MYDDMLMEGAQLLVICVFKFHTTNCVMNWRVKHFEYNKLFEKMQLFYPF